MERKEEKFRGESFTFREQSDGAGRGTSAVIREKYIADSII